jgi:hypothetical protein
MEQVEFEKVGFSISIRSPSRLIDYCEIVGWLEGNNG